MGGGDVLNQIRNLTGRAGIFSYGITQAMQSSPNAQGSTDQSLGINLYKPGQSNGILTSFAFLRGQVAPQFQAEWGGGMGQVIHDKFIYASRQQMRSRFSCNRAMPGVHLTTIQTTSNRQSVRFSAVDARSVRYRHGYLSRCITSHNTVE
jgi:hypothetical protein